MSAWKALEGTWLVCSTYTIRIAKLDVTSGGGAGIEIQRRART